MPIIDIHGHKVHVDHDSHSANFAAEYFKKNPDNARAIFAEAKINSLRNGTGAHYEVPKSHTTEDRGVIHHVSVIHNSDGTYTLQKRHSH